MSTWSARIVSANHPNQEPLTRVVPVFPTSRSFKQVAQSILEDSPQRQRAGGGGRIRWILRRLRRRAQPLALLIVHPCSVTVPATNCH